MKQNEPLTLGGDGEYFRLIREIEALKPTASLAWQKLQFALVKFKDLLFSTRDLSQEIKDQFDLLQVELRRFKFSINQKPLSLKVAKANTVGPILLEWTPRVLNSEYVIEYAPFPSKSYPDWQYLSKTKSTQFSIRGLEVGQSFWFRISEITESYRI